MSGERECHVPGALPIGSRWFSRRESGGCCAERAIADRRLAAWNYLPLGADSSMPGRFGRGAHPARPAFVAGWLAETAYISHGNILGRCGAECKSGLV